MLLTLLQILGCVLIADFISGLVHWLEDSYGNEDLPVIGRLVTLENNLHHQRPALMAQNSWWESSKILLAVSLLIGHGAWALGLFSWQLGLVLALGTKANQVHKWAHLSRRANGRVVTWLQRAKLVQSRAHHGRHRGGDQRGYYCVITPWLNPVFERIGFWSGFERAIAAVLGVERRDPGKGPLGELAVHLCRSEDDHRRASWSAGVPRPREGEPRGTP